MRQIEDFMRHSEFADGIILERRTKRGSVYEIRCADREEQHQLLVIVQSRQLQAEATRSSIESIFGRLGL